MANIIDGRAISLAIKDELKAQIPSLEAKYGRKPCLCVIIVGDNPASQVYVRNKVKAAEYVGIRSILISLPEDTPESELLRRIEELNADEQVDGILVQLPLPEHISENKVIDRIAREKDVDGLQLLNVGGLWSGDRRIMPCTPQGCLHLIKSTGIDIDGKVAVVVGRSNIVGKPTAKLLLDANASVIMTHSHTSNLKALSLQADILVVAVGKEKLITADMVKPGAVVIDVGINRNEEGKLCGDVDYDAVKDIAGWISPVPGGVGPMTIAMLMKNTVDCFLARN